jgi:hypothetical protein
MIRPAPRTDPDLPVRSAAAALLLTVLLTGCGGLLGGTRPFVLPLDGTAGSVPRAAVSLASFEVAPGANEVKATGTFPLGAFGEDDRRVVERSFRDTLAEVSWPEAPQPARDWKLHVLLRRHLVAHSSSSGGVLACVGWALVSGDGRVVFSEQFYASVAGAGSGRRNGEKVPDNLGRVKDALHRAIVERIVETALRLATAPGERTGSVAVAHTYETIQEAAQPLPTRLTSIMGIPPIAHRRVDWTLIDPQPPIDWARRAQH